MMVDVTHQLFRETAAAKTLRAQYADLIDGDEETAADFVEGETSLYEAINGAVSQMLDDLAAIEGIEAYLQKLTSRRDRFKARIANMKTALTVALEQAGKKTYTHEAVTLSIGPTKPSVIVTDEALIPSEFWTAGDPKLSKKAVAEALKAKRAVPGATMSNGGTCLIMRFS